MLSPHHNRSDLIYILYAESYKVSLPLCTVWKEWGKGQEAS